MSRSRRLGFLLLLVVMAGAPGHAQSDQQASVVKPEMVIGAPAGPPLSGEELDRRTQELASMMRCPVCQALSVADSPTTSALAMREEAKDLLAVGYSESQVLEYFEESYGEFILLAPRKKGLNWLVWLAPVAVLLAGAALILVRLGSRRSERPDVDTDGASGNDELAAYAERVRREVGQ